MSASGYYMVCDYCGHIEALDFAVTEWRCGVCDCEAGWEFRADKRTHAETHAARIARLNRAHGARHVG